MSKLHFSAQKMSDFLILYWGGRLTRTEELIDCGLLPKTKNLKWLHHVTLKILISSKPTWNSQWSLISSRNLKWEYHFTAHTSPIFSVFLKKNRFLRKSSKPGHGNLVLIIYFNWSSSTFKVEIQLWWYENLFSLGFKGLSTNNFCRT